MIRKLSSGLILVAILSAFSSLAGFAQTTISGKVTDVNDNKPLIGVDVRVKGTSEGTVTDKTGFYEIRVNHANATLIFSYLGYKTQEVKISGKSALDISLGPVNKELSKIVVIGYGSRRKSDLTTAVSSISGDQITDRPTTTNLVEGLAGKAAGVNVMINSGRPGGDPMIRIRGMGSLNSSNEPLYVMDGVVGVDPTDIDMSVVKSVDILKGAAAASIYGSRGSNGVVVITTKSGKRNSSRITLNNTLSFGFLQKELPVMNAKENLQMWKMEYDYIPGRLPPNLDPGNNFPRKSDLFNPDGSPIYNTNWQKEATRTAVSHNHSLTFSGGGDNFTAMVNISYRKDEGLMLNSYLKQINGFAKLMWDIKPWLHIQASLMAGGKKRDGSGYAGGGNNAVERMYTTLPFLPVKYPDGTYSENGDFPGASPAENPVRLLNELLDITNETHDIGNIQGTFHLTPYLDFTSTFSGQTSTNSHNYYAPIGLVGISEAQHGIAQRTNTETGSWTNEDYFTYNNTFGDHLLDATLGASWYYYTTTNTFTGAEDFFDDYFTFNSLQAGSVTELPTSGLEESQFNSFYGRIHYAYKDRYLLDLSYRIDGSSRFGADHKYGTFPSFSGGWIISKEPFFKGLGKTMNFLKLRASYGIVGNAEIGNYKSLAQLSNSIVIFDGSRFSAVTLSSLANPDLTWEKSNQFDIGFDMGFLNDRIHFTADAYNKITKGLLYTKNVPATTGYSNVLTNIGSIRNRGLEITVSSQNIRSRNFTWSTSFNYAMNRNKVLDINGDILYTVDTRIKEGEPINEYYGYVNEGVWSTSQKDEAASYGAKPGEVRYADLNHDGKITPDDRKDLGNGMPKFEANMTNTFTYKNLSFQFDLGSMVGLYLYNLAQQFILSSVSNANGLKILLNSWTPDHQDTKLSQLRLHTDPNSESLGLGSYQIQNGTYLRVRNISLKYKLEADWLRNISVRSVSFGVDVQNAFLFTKYPGTDPEVNSENNYELQGVDDFAYPKPRTVAFSLNFEF